MDYKRIFRKTMRAIVMEVSLSRKPGLVEPANSGAHEDMDYHTFLASATALEPYILEMCRISHEFDGSPKALFTSLQVIGIEAEEAMFKATKGVNTHKGMIFTMGLVSAATIQVMKHSNALSLDSMSDYIRAMTAGLSKSLGQGHSYGDIIYRQYGIRGVRGDAEAGYPIVFKDLVFKLKALRNIYSDERIYNHMLMHAMATTMDTNIIARHDLETLKEVQEMAKQFIDRYPVMNDQAMAALSQMDAMFINLNISPGGSADLLAMIIFLDSIII